MTPSQVKNSYARTLQDRVTVKRYTGKGASRTSEQLTDVRARVTGLTNEELIGTIELLGRKAIVFADDVAFFAPLTTNDTVVYDGREYAITDVDNATRKVGTTLVAYELPLKL